MRSDQLYTIVAQHLPTTSWVDLPDDEGYCVESVGTKMVAEAMWNEAGVVWC